MLFSFGHGCCFQIAVMDVFRFLDMDALFPNRNCERHWILDMDVLFPNRSRP